MLGDILHYSFSTSSNVIWVCINMYTGNESAIKELGIGGLINTIRRLYADRTLVKQVKAEFVFGGFNKLIHISADQSISVFRIGAGALLGLWYYTGLFIKERTAMVPYLLEEDAMKSLWSTYDSKPSTGFENFRINYAACSS